MDNDACDEDAQGYDSTDDLDDSKHRCSDLMMFLFDLSLFPGFLNNLDHMLGSNSLTLLLHCIFCSCIFFFEINFLGISTLVFRVSLPSLRLLLLLLVDYQC